MVQICSLASGSSGNAYLFCGKTANILVDAGASWRRISQKLDELNKPLSAILVTHEHIDHVRGLLQANKHGIPIYMSKGTSKAFQDQFGSISAEIVRSGNGFAIGGIDIMPYKKCHDAAEPISFMLEEAGKKISFITDAGHCCKHIREMISASDALFLESNHDIDLLKNGPYPHFLKNRILGEDGHLSNEDAAMAVLENAPSRLKHVFLSHLSETNNTHDLALGTFQSIIRERKDLKPSCIVSPRHMTSQLVKL
jgi:phosphoribosyl 1,2-cyclic phosphodiesterase